MSRQGAALRPVVVVLRVGAVDVLEPLAAVVGVPVQPDSGDPQ